MFKRRFIAVFLCPVLLFCALSGVSGCATKVYATDLMDGVYAGSVAGKATDDVFVNAMADFAVKLFKSCAAADKNSLISPLSVMLALSMTANGADTQTLSEMEAVLGRGISVADLNEYLYTYTKSLPQGSKYRFESANSIWFRDDENRLVVENDFLKTNADYYGAAAFKSPFDEQTLKDINNWVNDKTDGMIDRILDQIDADTVMYLINALVFEAEWEKVYNKNDIVDGVFTSQSGDKRSVKMMSSEETKYIVTDDAVGFIKDYKDGKYSFAALLPNEGIDLNDYVTALTGESLLGMIGSAENTSVFVSLPKFSYDYSVVMNNALKALGMPTAFVAGQADFSRLGRSSIGNIFIGEVLHKTFISVDELGTRAGAVTKVEMKDEAAAMNFVSFNRPFVYAIIDNATNLPVFLGTVLDIGE